MAVASDGWRAEGDDDEDADDVDVDAELAALADDPELDAYLQVTCGCHQGSMRPPHSSHQGSSQTGRQLAS